MYGSDFSKLKFSYLRIFDVLLLYPTASTVARWWLKLILVHSRYVLNSAVSLFRWPTLETSFVQWSTRNWCVSKYVNKSLGLPADTQRPPAKEVFFNVSPTAVDWGGVNELLWQNDVVAAHRTRLLARTHTQTHTCPPSTEGDWNWAAANTSLGREQVDHWMKNPVEILTFILLLFSLFFFSVAASNKLF